MTEKTLELFLLASREHALKLYDGKPYFYHLLDVYKVVSEFGYNEEIMSYSAILHDIMEDCGYTKNDVSKIAGEKVSDIVYLVSDHKGENREARKPLDYYLALKENQHAVVIKLADRIANARHSITNGHTMGDKYKKEYNHFRGMLKQVGHAGEMWKELDKLFNYKEQYEHKENI